MSENLPSNLLVMHLIC